MFVRVGCSCSVAHRKCCRGVLASLRFSTADCSPFTLLFARYCKQLVQLVGIVEGDEEYLSVLLLCDFAHTCDIDEKKNVWSNSWVKSERKWDLQRR